MSIVIDDWTKSKSNCSERMTLGFGSINFSFTGNFYLIKTDSGNSEFSVQWRIVSVFCSLNFLNQLCNFLNYADDDFMIFRKSMLRTFRVLTMV